MMVNAGFAEYAEYDGLGLADLVRRKEVRPEELVEAAIARIERLNPELNAVIHKMYDQARATAQRQDGPDGANDGPFAGVPFLVKDLLYALAGAPLTNGCRFMKNVIPEHDAEIIRRMKQSGLLILGKTNTPEFGLMPVTEPELFGPTRNPWDLSRTPGGSSGGSGAAVAARMVPLALGSDGAGSIRIPASCCGVFGLKPTRARTPTGPDVAESWMGLSIAHVITRSVRDSAAMLDAIAGPEPGMPYGIAPPERPYLEEVGRPPGRLRIAWTSTPLLGKEVDPECVAAVERTATLLGELGHDVEEAAPTLDREQIVRDFQIMVSAEAWADVQLVERIVGRKAGPRDFEAETWLFALLGRQNSADQYSAAMRTLRGLGQTMAGFHERYDVLLTPTLGKPPIPVNSLRATGAEAVMQKLLAALSAGRVAKWLGGLERTADDFFAFIPYTPVFNITGQPAMSVPLEESAAGLPIGMQFAGRFGDEATLFRLAAQLEEARPWANKVPPMAA